MGATSHDVTAKERRLDARYDMATPDGVRLFIEEIPKLQLLARESYYEAVILLVDFERALEMAVLSKRQEQVLKLYLLHGYTQQETAETLNISQPRVVELTALATEKIAQVYYEWALLDEGYELPKK
jgi:RNA polymerase sigma factor (sigma-70 family)